jgi:hypothetical protein
MQMIGCIDLEFHLKCSFIKTDIFLYCMGWNSIVPKRFSLKELGAFIRESHKMEESAQVKNSVGQAGFTSYSEYREGDFSYLDSQVGQAYAHRIELVRHQGMPVWSITHNGGLIPEFQANGALLADARDVVRQALKDSLAEFPFCGPGVFDTPGFTYFNNTYGDMTNFHGTYRVYRRPGALIFYADYVGGLII